MSTCPSSDSSLLPLPSDLSSLLTSFPTSQLISSPLELIDQMVQILPETHLKQIQHSWGIPELIQHRFYSSTSSPSLSLPSFSSSTSSSSSSSFFSCLPHFTSSSPLHLIPSLNQISSDFLSPNSLVRFRCMVVDLYSFDLYLGIYQQQQEEEEEEEEEEKEKEIGEGGGEKKKEKKKIKKKATNKYRDVMKIPSGWELVDERKEEEEDHRMNGGFGLNHSSKNQIMYERGNIKCIAIPGENTWIKEIVESKMKTQMEQQSGSASSSSSSSAVAAATTAAASEANGSGKKLKKRVLDDETMVENDEGTNPNNPNNEIMETDGSKKNRLSSSTSVPNSSPTEPLYPSSSSPLECIVTLYDSYVNTLKVGDMIEVIGILAVNPELANGIGNGEEEEDEDEMSDRTVFSSKALRLHCMHYNKLPTTFPFLSSPSPSLSSSSSSDLSTVRSSLLNYITSHVCGGDELSSEMLLLNLLSKVESRPEDALIGHFVLNLVTSNPITSSSTNTISSFPSTLSSLFSLLLPRSVTLSLTPSSLTTSRFSPTKNYQTNTLSTTSFQCSSGTMMLLDESEMKSCRLNEMGVLNLRTLKKLIQKQQLEYDFTYHQMDFEVDLPICIVSQGKSILPVHLVCRLQPNQTVGNTQPSPEMKINETELPSDSSSSSSSFSLPSVPSSLVSLWRHYLLTCRSSIFSLPPSSSTYIESYFTTCRSQSTENFTVENLHELLTLARLYGRSWGEEIMTEERWKEIVEKVEKVKERNEKINGGKGKNKERMGEGIGVTPISGASI